MSVETREATFTIGHVFTKDGETSGRKWTRYDVKPEENPDERYTTFNDQDGLKAQEWRGRKVKVEYEVTDRGNKIKDIMNLGPPADGAAPAVRAKEQPETQRAIHASVALEAAVNAWAHTIKVDADIKETNDRVLASAQRYFNWLNSQVTGDVPF